MSLKVTVQATSLLKIFEVQQTCEPFFDGSAAQRSAAQSSAAQRSATQRNAAQHSSAQPSAPHRIALYRIASHCIASHCIASLYCIVVSHRIVSHCIALQRILLLSLLYTFLYSPLHPSPSPIHIVLSLHRSVKVWDINKGYCTHNFKEHTSIVQLLYFHPDPKRLLVFSSGDDNTIRVNDLKAQKVVATFRDHVSLPTQLAISNSIDGNLMVSCGMDQILNFYDVRGSNMRHVKTVPVLEELYGVCILSSSDTAKALSKSAAGVATNAKQFVVATVGAKGVLKTFRVVIAVRVNRVGAYLHPVPSVGFVSPSRCVRVSFRLCMLFVDLGSASLSHCF
jgi:hypothetical protein